MKRCFLLIFVSLIVNRVFAGALDNSTNVFEHFPNVNVDAHMLKIAQRHFQDIREGTVPADTNELARARQIPLLDWDHTTPQQIAGWFRRTLHAWAIGGGVRKRSGAFPTRLTFGVGRRFARTHFGPRSIYVNGTAR